MRTYSKPFHYCSALVLKEMLLRPLKIFEIRLESAVLFHNSGGYATVRALRAEAADRGPSPISPSWLPVWTKDGCPRMSMHDLSEWQV